MTKLINLTPHAIRIRIDESNEAIPLDTDIVLAPTTPVARLDVSSVVTTEVNGIPVKKSAFGNLTGLPEPTNEDIVYIVSLPVAQYAAQLGRLDVVSPNTAPKQDIRYPADHKLAGLTFAVRSFQQF